MKSRITLQVFLQVPGMARPYYDRPYLILLQYITYSNVACTYVMLAADVFQSLQKTLE